MQRRGRVSLWGTVQCDRCAQKAPCEVVSHVSNKDNSLEWVPLLTNINYWQLGKFFYCYTCMVAVKEGEDAGPESKVDVSSSSE